MPQALRRGPGGIAGLLALLEEHKEAVEADLHWRYGIDLLDLWRPGGKLSWRKLGVLIRHLPPESATATAQRNAADPEALARAAEHADPATGRWSHMEMLLASLVDAVRQLIWTTAAVRGAKGKQPEPMARPGVQPSRLKRQPLTPEQTKRLFRWINPTGQGDQAHEPDDDADGGDGDV